MSTQTEEEREWFAETVEKCLKDPLTVKHEWPLR